LEYANPSSGVFVVSLSIIDGMTGMKMSFGICPSCVEGKLRGRQFEKQVKGMFSLLKKSEVDVLASSSCWF